MLEALRQAALRSLLLAAVVQFCLWLLRIRQARLLLIAWTVILAASLAMPALQWATPLRVPVLPELSGTTLIGAADPQVQPFALETPGRALATERPPLISPWLEAVYFVVSSILLLRLTVGIALSLRMLGKAVPLPAGWIADHWPANAHIRISRHVAAPVTIANVILLPLDAVDWPAPMRQAVLAHEHAHVVRWDFAMLVVSQVNRAVFWFSPLSWWLHRRLAALAELASDDHAMEVTGDRPGYAEVLLEMGRRSGPVLRGLAMARHATLRHRIERVISGRAGSNPVSPRQRVMLALGAAGLAFAAASSDLSSAPPLDVTALTKQQEPAALPDATPSLSAQAPKDAQDLNALASNAPASKAPPHSMPSMPSDRASAIAPSRPAARMVARAISHPPARDWLGLQSSHVTRRSNPVSGGQVELDPLQGAKAVDAAGTLSHVGNAAADEHRPASASHAAGYVPVPERPILKLINDRTCTGIYMPQRAASLASNGANLVRVKLFQDASGTPWLTFFVGEQTPVIQPVTVTHGEDKLTALRNVVFTMVPRSARRLDGFIKRSYGTIDFDCGGSDAHLFDGAS